MAEPAVPRLYRYDASFFETADYTALYSADGVIRRLTELTDGQLRFIGLVSIGIGVLGLYLLGS